MVLVMAVILGFKYCRPVSARVGLALAGVYLLLGVWQHQTALRSATELATKRGHEFERIIVKPTLANLVLWRSVYQSNDMFYVDAIRISPGPKRVYPGGSVPAFDLEREHLKLVKESVLSRDIVRFSKLANGYVVSDPGRDNVLIDIRYSMLPTSITPMWGIDLNVMTTSQHAKFEVYRDRPNNALDLFLAMLLGRDLPN